MRVLHLYAGNLYGGIETYLVALAKTQALLPQMQHEFALCFSGRLSAELQDAGAVVHQLGTVQIRKVWTVWNARSRLKTVLEQGHFDLVICHACWVQTVFGVVVKAHQLPLVFYCHDVLSGQSWLERLAKWATPDLIVANSRYTQSNLGIVYPGIASEVIYCPVLSSKAFDRATIRSQVRSQLQTSEEQVVIVQACRLEPWKGHRSLIAALGRLKHVPNWQIWIAGGAQRPHEQVYLASLQSEIETLGIADRVKFLGQRSDVPQLLAAADIHCQPNSSGEPFGIAFIEALYAGLPVVTTAIGAASEIVNKTCGFLAPVGDVDALTQVLERLITNAEARDRLSRNSCDRAAFLCDPLQQLKKLQSVLEPYTHLADKRRSLVSR